MNIGGVEIASKLALAPMAGVTDSAFRQICSELGAGLTYTELVSAKALCYQDKKSRELLRLFPGESPCCAQIFGSDPACMAEAAQIAEEASGATFIDINMGCPVGKVVNNGDGSALMKDPEKAARIAEAVVRASSVPVTVKMRRGWDKGSMNAVELSKMLEEVGVAAIAVHGRTRTQMYSGQVTSGAARSIPVMELPSGNGTIVLTATVQTGSGPVSAARTWTYNKTPISFPASGGVAQLTKSGANLLPKTLAEAVRTNPFWGGSLDKALDKLTRAVTYATAGDFYDLLGNVVPSVKIATGSYVGTGTAGESSPNTLTFPFEPKMVVITAGNPYNGTALLGPTTGFSYLTIASVNNIYYMVVTVNQNSISWYTGLENPDGSYRQMNDEYNTYSYVAIG